MSIELYDHQKKAISKMKNGCILNGGVGSGKSRAALAYYYKLQGGDIYSNHYVKMKDPKDLYIITTAQKRDKKEWEADMLPFYLSTNQNIETNNTPSLYHNVVIVDSWNNIQKYKDVKDAFFIFDEQRVVGSGAWAKAFLKITKANEWILLSATPGDKWEDYIPVFIANGFYKNRSEFKREHLVCSYYGGYEKVERYLNTGRLIRQRNSILIDMDFNRKTIAHHEDVYVDYDHLKYKDIMKTRWNPYTDEPIQQASGLCYVLRRLVNTDISRQIALMEIIEKTPRAIIFYNFDYELELLKELLDPLCLPWDDPESYEMAEWNGHNHQPIPDSKKWIYLVQYTAGAEGWNCIKTDTIIFFSQNYSYKAMAQAAGRIDRLNTPFKDLYYYHLKSRSGIDLAISRSLKSKKKFNENSFVSSLR